MDLKMLAKLAQQKAEASKEPPAGTASVVEIAAALGVKPGQIARKLAAGKVRGVGRMSGGPGVPGYAYYDLEQVAVALGLAPVPKGGRGRDE